MTRQSRAGHQGKTQRPTSTSKDTKAAEARTSFAQTYPAIAQWIESCGWVEMGQDDYSRSMVRALNLGGMVWEGESNYASLDELLRDLEDGLAAWLEANG